jgi:spore photoproduct lyase
MPRVYYKDYIGLEGRRKRRISKVGSGVIICRFEKTPPPINPADVVCPHFLELKWANGCYFECAWCYLQGTYRFHPEWKNGRPNIKDFHLVESHLAAFIKSNGINPELLNSGELSDSLLSETGKNPFSKFIVSVLDKYDKHNKHKVLFLTKSTYVKNLLEIKRPDRIIMSFSLNAHAVARRWERRAPPVRERIKAAKKVYDAGYITRIRIDPMVPIEGWKEYYFELIDEIFSNFIPERITLGSLRGLASTINNAKDKSWTIYLSEKSNWGKKIDFNTRYRMYSAIINYLEEKNYDKIALCKETREMWERLGLNWRNIRCNCLL